MKKPSKVEIDCAVLMSELGHIKESVKDLSDVMKQHVESSTSYRQQTKVNTKSIGWIWTTIGLLVSALGGLTWMLFTALVRP
jgi:hypothetical protein